MEGLIKGVDSSVFKGMRLTEKDLGARSWNVLARNRLVQSIPVKKIPLISLQ